MRIQNCFHPKVVTNPYTGHTITCRCGKCPACLNARSSSWVQRLDMESACHKYTLFCTGTYDEFNVPQIIRMRKDDYSEPAYIDCDSGQIFELSEIHETFSDQDKQFVRDTKVLNVLSKSDIQKFIKRLRYYFTQIDKNAKLSYFICGEYGPRTYRPHWHLLLFFDSELCQQNIEVLLRKAWTLGHIYDPHLVHGTASEYCASYINSLASLPKIYLHKQLRPFTLFSKSPSIGSRYPSLQDIRGLYFRGDNSFRAFHKLSNEFKDVPFWRSFEARLYPRLQRFSSLSHADRMQLYREISCRAEKAKKATEIVSLLEKELPRDKERCITFFHRYLWTISHKLKYKYHFVGRNIELPVHFRHLPFLPKDFQLEGDMDAIKVPTYEYCRDSLLRFVRTSLRVLKICKDYDFTLNEFDLKMQKYYEKRDLDRLKKDFQFQNDYFSMNPKWHYIYFDKSFYDKVISSDFNSLTLATRIFLKDLFNGNVPLKDKVITNSTIVYKVLDIPPLSYLPDFQNMKFLHTKIAKDLTKTKENNDYAKLRQDKFSNIIKYQNL